MGSLRTGNAETIEVQAASSLISSSDFTFTLRTQSSKAFFSKKISLPAGL